jgi:uncharacterized membrane protein
MAELQALLYRSEALSPESRVKERQFLAMARQDNAQNSITGFLHRENDIYYQWLEGPELDVAALFDKIAKDDRHQNVEVLSRHPILTRNFPSWTMAYASATQCSLFDWAAERGIGLHPPRPEDILAFMRDCADRQASRR